MVLTTVMSWGVNVFSAARALSSIGKASPSSLSHSSLIALAAAACSLATASSAFTIYMENLVIYNKQQLDSYYLRKSCVKSAVSNANVWNFNMGNILILEKQQHIKGNFVFPFN